MTLGIYMTMYAVKKFIFRLLWNSLLYFCFNVKNKHAVLKKLDPNVFVVSSNNEKEVPTKKTWAGLN